MVSFEYVKAIQELLNKLSPEGDIQFLAWGLSAGVAFVWAKEENDQVHVFIHNPDGHVFTKTQESVKDLFDQNQYCLMETCAEKNEFLNNEIEMIFAKIPAPSSDVRQKDLLAKLQTVARENNLQCRAILNIDGGRAWLNFSRVEDNDYKVQISTGQSFEAYKKIRDDCCEVFRNFDAVLADEHDYKSRPLGFQKEFSFIDKTKYERLQTRNAKPAQVTTIGTQINSNIKTVEGNINTGSAGIIDNSSTDAHSDRKWFQKEIVKMIFSFVGGVAATLVAQYIMRILGWIA